MSNTKTSIGYFTWADEPPPTHPKKNKPKSKYDLIADKLKRSKKNHGRWARVDREVHYTIVTKLRKSHPEIQWTSRKNSNGKWDLWASYPKQPTENTVGD